MTETDRDWSLLSGERAHRQLIVRRLRIFAAGWSATVLAWALVLALTLPRARALAGLLLASQLVVLLAGVVICRRDPEAARVPLVVALTLVALGFLFTAIFAAAGGYADVLAFILLTLYLASALLFAWGWMVEASVLAPTLVVFALALPFLRPAVPPLALATAIAIGVGVSLAIAEASARAFRTTLKERESEARSRALVRALPDMVFRVHRDGRVLDLHAERTDTLRMSRDALIGANIRQIPLPPEVMSALLEAASRALAGSMQRVEYAVPTPEGRREYEARIVANGRDEVVAVVRDITKRKRAEQELRESEARYRGIVQSSLALICRVDREGRFTFLNDAYCRMLGKRPDELIGQHASTVVHEDDGEALREMERAIETPSYRPTVECRNRTPSGWVWTSWEASAVKEERGATVEMQAFGRDVSERRVAEEALRASFEQVRRSEERLRLLARRQAEIREEERKRLGFDLHDDVCQELIGVTILVEALRRRLAPLPAADASELDRIMRYLSEVVEHLRGMARDLRPLLLHDLGLEASLRALAEGMTSAETRIVLEFATPTPRLDEVSELGVYRIAQEALANAVRHAAARTIVMTLTADDGRLSLEVRDDGRGFDPDDRVHSSCLGLASMEERAVALGASFALRSEPGKGTVVSVEYPLASRVPAGAA